MLRCRNSIWGKKRKRQELYGSVCNVIGKYSHHCILIAPPLSLFPYSFPYLLPLTPFISIQVRKSHVASVAANREADAAAIIAHRAENTGAGRFAPAHYRQQEIDPVIQSYVTGQRGGGRWGGRRRTLLISPSTQAILYSAKPVRLSQQLRLRNIPISL